jgi:hypothetical protein
MDSSIQAVKKQYSCPNLKTRTVEQASLFLVGYAWVGDKGAWDLLELLFPQPSSTKTTS